MRKLLFAFSVICIISVAVLGCKSELKSARVFVKTVEISNDSPKSMVIDIEGQEKIVRLQDARFQNGIVLNGDSVILDYTDWRDDSLRALVVTVLPKPAQEFVPTDTVATFDATIESTADSIQ